MALDIWSLVGIGCFYIIMLAAGFWASRRKGVGLQSETSEELMLAGRRIGLIVGVFTLTATEVGGGFINGTAEQTFSKGLLWCQVPFGYALSIALNGIFFARKMRERGYVTMFDPLQHVFGYKMGALLFLLHFVGDVFWTAAILAVLGDTLSTVTGLNRATAILVSSAVALVYTLMGGMASVAYTDVLQLVFLVFGLWLSVPFILTSSYIRPMEANWTISEYLGTVETSDLPSYLETLAVPLIGGIPWQAYYQRVLSMKSASTVQVLSISASMLAMLMALPPVIVGAAARQIAWNETLYGKDLSVSDAPLVMPLSLQYLTPRVVAFFGLGAVVAAVMSSIDSAMLGAASCITRNVYAALIRPKAEEKELLWVTRGSILLVGILGTAIAFAISSIYGILFMASDLLYVILLPQFIFALVKPNWCSPIGSGVGYLTALILRLLSGEPFFGLPAVIKFPNYNEASGEQKFPFRTTIMVLSSLLTIIISRFTNHRSGSFTMNEKYEIKKDFDELELHNGNGIKAAIISH